MVAEKRLYFIKKNLILFVNILAAFAITNAVIAIVAFVLYGRARMKEQEEKEKFFLSIHYACLFLLFLAGIVFMFFMVETET
jgi:formate hydrogenlyase subunit 3/multisubunit Na+/H+ antiporter MnhD subunit